MSSRRLFCCFRLNDRLFGLDVHDVKEVTAETSFTRVAHAPDEVLGLVNIRGHVYLALDLRRLLGMPPTVVTDHSRLVLFKSSVGNAFGVIVDQIADIRSSDAGHIESFNRAHHDPALMSAGRVHLIDSVCQLADELLIVLNPRRFLAVIEQSLAATT